MEQILKEIKQHTGSVDGARLRVAIIAARYNDFVTSRLVFGAIEALREHGVAADHIEIFWCPGALELPATLSRVAGQGCTNKFYDAAVVIGCVIKGDTDHYQFVCTEAMRGINHVALQAQVAIGNALLTVENSQQAMERSGEKTMNKGYEAAMAAIEIANLYHAIR